MPGLSLVALLAAVWKLGPLQGAVVGLGILTFLLLVAGARLLLESEVGPRLVFVDTEVSEAHVVSSSLPVATQAATASTYASYSASASSPGTAVAVANDFARVQVANDPLGSAKGVKAEKVVGRIAFLAADGSELIPEMVGRWAETPQRIETGRIGLSLEEAQLDIDANGLPHPLDVAMKEHGGDGFFAYNYENSNADGARLEKHRLSVDVCRVRITLRPANGAATIGEFLLHNDADGLRWTTP